MLAFTLRAYDLSNVWDSNPLLRTGDTLPSFEGLCATLTPTLRFLKQKKRITIPEK
ncbi:hypothetical protein QIU19_04470 [Capnocytophaga canimorsus]|nr:hypothetical protein [Capnocytophaga canimorsus]WGU69103.1 hypothetical protein QIU19_04470 [Capnocytophaga canimorsus]